MALLTERINETGTNTAVAALRKRANEYDEVTVSRRAGPIPTPIANALRATTNENLRRSRRGSRTRRRVRIQIRIQMYRSRSRLNLRPQRRMGMCANVMAIEQLRLRRCRSNLSLAHR